MAITALTAAAGIASAVGTLASAKASANAANYNAQVAENNATYSRQIGAENERRQRVQNTKALGSIRAKYGASGITLDGSPSDVLAENAANAELEALMARHAGIVEAIGYKNTAALDRSRARSATTAGYLGAASDLLATGAKIAHLNRTG